MRLWSSNISGEPGQYHGCLCAGSLHYQMPWYQPYGIIGCLSCVRNVFNHLRQRSVESKIHIYVFPETISAGNEQIKVQRNWLIIINWSISWLIYTRQWTESSMAQITGSRLLHSKHKKHTESANCWTNIWMAGEWRRYEAHVTSLWWCAGFDW